MFLQIIIYDFMVWIFLCFFVIFVSSQLLFFLHIIFHRRFRCFSILILLQEIHHHLHTRPAAHYYNQEESDELLPNCWLLLFVVCRPVLPLVLA